MRHQSRTRLIQAMLLWVSSACATSLTCAAPVSVSNTNPLAFGKFAAGAGGAVLIASTGTRSATGGVVMLSSDGGSAARFAVSGDANLTYAVSLPPNGAVSLVRTGGQSMSVTNFVSSPVSTGLLNALGQQTLSVGARLNVGVGQQSGSYTGSFVIYVDYN